MLQIATGRLFTRPVSRENQLRGALFTNARLSHGEVVETAIGRLLPSSGQATRANVLVYEFIERIEAEEQGPGVLVSSGVDPYLREFAVVVSFALNCVCTPDVDLARRLTSGERGLATRVAPASLVQRFFGREVWCQDEDRRFLVSFTEKLINLPRQTFLAVMRALRTYIHGMHRIADDLELAYTLLVASVESLAQDFDGHESDWESVEERKRVAIDAALAGADADVAQRVRKAIQDVEHVALARRFREFATAHVGPAYFRPRGDAAYPLLGRSDLKEALSLAYQSRSKYVHQLKRLPHVLTMGHFPTETATDNRATHLTFQGLTRLLRSVIVEFVMRQPSLEREPHDYQLQRDGVARVRLAPQYWVGDAEGDLTRAGRDKLEGCLEQLASWLMKAPDAVVTDLRPVLAAVDSSLPTMEKRLRLPYLALYVAFNSHIAAEQAAPVPAATEALINRELNEPSAEALIAHVLSYQAADWPIEAHEEALQTYLRRRGAAGGLRFPRVFEAAVTLDFAERLRAGGEVDRSRAVVALAVENYPEHRGLRAFEEAFDPTEPIQWPMVLLPKPAQVEQPGAQA